MRSPSLADGTTVEGTVVKGDGRGRQLGFPTANVRVESGAVLPRGVFTAQVEVDGRRWVAVANIGTRPTFEGEGISVEVHLLDFEGDLYGQSLRLTLGRHLRGERRFGTVEELRQQIAADIQRARTE